MRTLPPYPVEVPKEEIESQACCWKTEETIWRHIGTVDSLEAARYLVENDEFLYNDSEDNVYYLECEPSDELFYAFAKIEVTVNSHVFSKNISSPVINSL